MAHLDAEALKLRLRSLPRPPRGVGRVVKLVQRLPEERRASPERAQLVPGRGMLGDRWVDGAEPDVEAEVTVMRADVAAMLTDGGDIAPLGDNIFVRLDLSAANLPPGTRLRVGTARCEVTPKPHTGCDKFAARVGLPALRLTASAAGRRRNLRGIHIRVLEAGEVAVGDAIVVEARA